MKYVLKSPLNSKNIKEKTTIIKFIVINVNHIIIVIYLYKFYHIFSYDDYMKLNYVYVKCQMSNVYVYLYIDFEDIEGC